MASALKAIFEYKIIAILRGLSPDAVQDVAAALYDGGIRCLEITLNSPDALSVIKNLSVRMGDRLLIGAGTVLEAAEAEAAIGAGARFIISPALDIATIQVTKKLDVVSVPGAFTATEILTAYRNGADLVKVFPATAGPAYFKDLAGPLPHIPLMPTGGVNLENILAFHQAGAVAFGIGSALVNSKQSVTEEGLRQLTDKATRFSNAVPQMGKQPG